ncbi:hypothetical protein COLO4_06058 [Corchorus olitorius]|uniref:Uncharacterized protein n=1 Tax=Corchorus olitorius TaxID=93759 RepID=A0A1R3KP46_9ROSI|nr:hypothetical protein COLO4_06058 [Corchorus olitorius]
MVPDISQHKFVQTTVKDSQVAQAIESLTNAIAVINTNINLMRKSNLMYQQNTHKIPRRLADKILGESLENEDLGNPSMSDGQLEDSDETPHEEGKQHKDFENVIEEEEEDLDLQEDNEENEETKAGDDDDNINDEVEDEEERDKNKRLEGDAEEDLNETGEDGSDLNQEEAMAQTSEEDDRLSTEKAPSTAVGETNVSGASSETNSEEGDLTLATTEEVIAGLESLATAPASPKGKGKAKPSSHSTSYPTERASVVIKPNKKVTNKATTATDKAPAHATKNDVVSEATKLPPAVPSKRPMTKHPNVVDASETIPAAAPKPAKVAGTWQSKRIKKA